MTLHLLVDRNGHPLAVTATSAKGDEREQVQPLLQQAGLLYQRKHIWQKRLMPILEANKGYDTQWLRQELLNQGIFPGIPFRQFKNPSSDRPPFREVKAAFQISSCRWVVERTFSWIKRQSRRLLMRWERKQELWTAIVKVGIIRY